MWIQQTALAGWYARHGGGSVVLSDDSIVLMGGFPGGILYTNDVWRSTDAGVTWTQQTAAAGWIPRYAFGSVVLSDGSIVIMGGHAGSYGALNDVWRSTDAGVTWTQQTAAAGWSIRHGMTAIVLSDDTIVLMGGWPGIGGSFLNDVWISTDAGVTWTQQTAAAAWAGRVGHNSVILSDDTIVLMGGRSGGSSGPISYTNDVWISTDAGVTWIQQTAAAAWDGRYRPGSVVLSDDSIVLMGGISDSSEEFNDVWRSTDAGVTWIQQTAAAAWVGRQGHSSVILSDDSIILIGGLSDGDTLSDVWLCTDYVSHHDRRRRAAASLAGLGAGFTGAVSGEMRRI